MPLTCPFWHMSLLAGGINEPIDGSRDGKNKKNVFFPYFPYEIKKLFVSLQSNREGFTEFLEEK